MGLAFRLNLKLGAPPYSHFLPKFPPSSSSPSLSRGRESSHDSARLSFSFGSSLQSEYMCNDLLQAQRSSGTSPVLENDYPLTQGIQMENMVDDENQPSSQKQKSSYFGLLMENVGKLEAMSTNSDMALLEKNILQQLERLGALKLFHICLSRTLKSPTLFGLSDTPTQLIEPQINNSANFDKPMVLSRRKGKRKLRQGRASGQSSRLALPSKSIEKEWDFYFSRRLTNSRSRRLMIAKNEAEMSKGVQMVDNLENIRTVLEKETDRAASLSSWAEAAGVDVKVLQQQLHFGWYCRDELLRSTRSLVLYVARTYRGSGIALEDIIQAGNIGVLQGAIRFDHTRGCRFSTYVQYWIRKSMSTLVAQHSRGVRIPPTLSKAINHIQKARKALTHSHGNHPDDDEIAKFTGLSSAKITAAGKCSRVVGSINQKTGDSTSAKFSEFTPDTSIGSPEETVMRSHMIKEMRHLLSTLEPTERQVLVLRFGIGSNHRKSLKEIGRLFCASKESIRRVERKALTKLSHEAFHRNLGYYIHS